jgi:hypothetical protein
MVTVTPSADTGSTFTGWSGACTGSGSCVVTMDATKSVTATFTIGTNALTVLTDGTGTGTISSNPSGIDCGDTCAAIYDYGTVVTLTAVADTNSTFSGWAGACTNTSGDCVVTMNQAKNVTATFAVTYQIFLPIIIKP